MKTCSFCGTDNPDDGKYCKQCGKSLDEPQTEPSERDILLQVRTLLDKLVKLDQDIWKESQEYRTQERQYLERAEKRAQTNARNNVAMIAFAIIVVIILIVLTITS